MHRTDKFSQYSSIIWPVWLNDWVLVYELSGCGFNSHYSHSILSSLRFWEKESFILKTYKQLLFYMKAGVLYEVHHCMIYFGFWYSGLFGIITLPLYSITSRNIIHAGIRQGFLKQNGRPCMAGVPKLGLSKKNFLNQFFFVIHFHLINCEVFTW